MRLLFDQNLSAKLCGLLSAPFPRSSHVRILGFSEATDAEIWNVARDARYILVTQDADFAEMAALKGHPPKIIWIKTGNKPTAEIAGLLHRNSELISVFANDDSAACLELYDNGSD